MGCLFFKKDGVNNFSDAMSSDTGIFSQYFTGMIEKGIYLAPSQYEAMFLSAAHSEKDLEDTSSAMKDVLMELFG